MNLPGFNAESSVAPTLGRYQATVLFQGSGVPQILPTQGMSAGPIRRRASLRSSASSMLAATGGSRSLESPNCIDILYTPVCHSPNPLTECCTHRHELRCTECSSPTDCCTNSQQFSCSECHSTISAFPDGGVLEV